MSAPRPGHYFFRWQINMSTINEALQKAQKDREARYLKYSGILAASEKEKRFLDNRAIWWIFLLLILLAFTSYTWLDSKDQKQIKAPSKPKIPEKTSQNDNVIKAKAFYDKARHLHKSGRLEDARRFYLKTLRLDPGYVDALNNLGVIYIHDRDYMAAQRNLEKAIRLKPMHADLYYNLACLYAIKGEVRQSLNHLKKAVSLDHSVKDWARKDADLENLRGRPEFEEIMGRGINIIPGHAR